MSQSILGNSYERQSALKAAIGLEGSMIAAGLLKPADMEDAFMISEVYYQRYLERLTSGQDTATLTQTGFADSKPPEQNNNDPMVTVRLSDGEAKTKPNKERLKELGFWWNRPESSYDWSRKMRQTEWVALSKEKPFCDFKVKME